MEVRRKAESFRRVLKIAKSVSKVTVVKFRHASTGLSTQSHSRSWLSPRSSLLPHRKHEPKSKIIKDLKHGEEDYVRFIPGITLAVHDSCHFRDSSRTGFSCDIVRGKNGHTHTHTIWKGGEKTTLSLTSITIRAPRIIRASLLRFPLTRVTRSLSWWLKAITLWLVNTSNRL